MKALCGVFPAQVPGVGESVCSVLEMGNIILGQWISTCGSRLFGGGHISDISLAIHNSDKITVMSSNKK